MRVAIVGGGAAGFFSAIHVKENYPNAVVVIYEKSKKLLSKVKVSGGGRCNVTNGCTSIKDLSKSYPRGEKALKKAFAIFNTKHAKEWFESHGVPLVVQDDNCVFPVSQNSQSIIDCFLSEVKRLNIRVETGCGITKITGLTDNKIELVKSTNEILIFDKVIIATGGSPKRAGLNWLEELNHEIENPVPSLFTFNMPTESITTLMGIVVENSIVKIQGTKFISEGPLLVTHWGMSGPSILKLSAFGARYLSENDYKFKIQVNWVNVKNVSLIEEEINQIIELHSRKNLTSVRPYFIPDRLWRFLLEKLNFSPTKKWDELGKKGLHKITNILSNDIYQITGKTTFKEEFVTCGGVSLASINLKTMESKVCKNLYFAGEVMDIDGITGGFNFQAAWTTGFIAAKLQNSI